MSYDERLGDYNDVASRMREFFERYPDGRLRPAAPWRVEQVGDKAFVVYEAAAYRTHDDPLPGIGTAWEPFPGRTPYTRDSELMNAETSAWGRAILAVGAADTRKGIASREEVRNRQADREHEQQRPDPEKVRQNILANAEQAISTSPLGGLPALAARVSELLKQGAITPTDATDLADQIEHRRAQLAANRERSLPAEDRTAEPPEMGTAADLSRQEPMDGDGVEWPEAAKPGNPT